MSSQAEIALENASNKMSNRKIDAGKFAVWLFVISVTMIFAAMSSAYIVRRAEGNWLEFELPSMLNWSSLVIVASSITLIGTAYFTKKAHKYGAVATLFSTFALGVVFLWLQFQAWSQLVDAKVFFGGDTSNPAGSFVYVFTGLHGFHIITGLVYVLITSIRAAVTNSILSLKNTIEKCSIYWHFLGILWIYLYLFLYLYN